MEAGTHAVVGVLIQILCFRFLIFPFNIIFTIIFAFFSHFLVDALADITYHTPEALTEDKFWVFWHIIILIFSIFTLIWFFIPYWIGEISAISIDIWDWLILRGIQKRRKLKDPDFSWKKNYFIHKSIDKFRKKLFFWLPNWRYKKAAVLTEIIIISILWISIYSLINS
jgi:hypothetical protein